METAKASKSTGVRKRRMMFDPFSRQSRNATNIDL
jgi:hypothetical protein